MWFFWRQWVTVIAGSRYCDCGLFRLRVEIAEYSIIIAMADYCDFAHYDCGPLNAGSFHDGLLVWRIIGDCGLLRMCVMVNVGQWALTPPQQLVKSAGQIGWSNRLKVGHSVGLLRVCRNYGILRFVIHCYFRLLFLIAGYCNWVFLD